MKINKLAFWTLFLTMILSGVETVAYDGEGKGSHRGKGKFKEERIEYEKEGIELRRGHIEEVRKKHLDLINKMYDLKLTQLSELEEMGKKIEAASPEERKELMQAMKEKRKEHKKAQREYREKTMKKELHGMREGFHEKMKQRREELKKSKAN